MHRTRLMTTSMRHDSWDHLTLKCEDLTFRDEANRISVQGSFQQDTAAQPKKPQRKRTLAGTIKEGKEWHVANLTSALLQGYTGNQDPTMKLRMDADILRRRIAAIEAQKKDRKAPAASPKETESQRQRVQNACGRDAEGQHNILDWQEIVLR